MSLIIPKEPLYILSELQKKGFESYIVGGAVRDLLRLSKKQIVPQFDFDITTNAKPEQIQQIFPESFYENEFGTVGISHQYLRAQMGLSPIEVSQIEEKKDKTIDLNQVTKLHQSLSIPQAEKPKIALPNFEITTYRSDEVYSDFRKPDNLTWGETLSQDLSRRDFTINALALGIEDQTLLSNLINSQSEVVELKENEYVLIDLFNGLADLDQHLIKTVGDANQRFQEDALRMLRAVRFAVQLNMQIADPTFEAITQHANLIKHISWERISQELMKVLKSDYPAEGIEILDQTGLLTHILPELIKGKGVEQGGHHDTDVWTHSLDSLRTCPSKDPIVRLASLIHDIGKPDTFQIINGNITFYNHEVIGARIAKNIARRLRLSKDQLDKIFILVRYHMFYYQPQNTDASIRRFMRKVGLENINDILDVREADRLGSGAKKTSWRLEEMKQRMIEQLNQPMDVTDLAINGHDLMSDLNLTPGPKMGEILNSLLEEVLENPQLNNRAKLLDLAKYYLK